MEDVEIEVGIVYPVSYFKKRSRKETKVFVRDEVSILIPRLSEAEAPIVVAGACLLRNVSPFERRLFGDHLLNRAIYEKEGLKTILGRLAAGDLTSVFGRGIFTETQFHLRSTGGKPTHDAIPLDVETIVANHRDEVRKQAVTELSNCAIVSDRLYFPDIVPSFTLTPRGGYAIKDGINGEFSFHGDRCDIMDDFHFSLHHETEAMQVQAIINEAHGFLHGSFPHYRLDILDRDVSERYHIPEALLNSATAAKLLLFEAGPFLSHMTAEGVEILTQIIRQRDRIEAGEEQAYWGLIDSVKALCENDSFVAMKYASARSTMQRTTKVVSAALEFTEKPKAANKLSTEVGDGLEHLTGF